MTKALVQMYQAVHTVWTQQIIEWIKVLSLCYYFNACRHKSSGQSETAWEENRYDIPKVKNNHVYVVKLRRVLEFSHNTQSWQRWHLIQMHQTIFKEWKGSHFFQKY